jgi:hypothetical protein
MFLGRGRSIRLFHYESITNSLWMVRVLREELIVRLRVRAQQLLPEADGHLIALLGRHSVVENVYQNSESLLWRDGGALLQTLSMTATSIGLGFCPLGLLGTGLVEALGVDGSLVQALGLAWLGRPACDLMTQRNQ